MYMCIYRHAVILISNFRRVLNVVCVLLGDSPGNHPKESIQHAVMFTHTHTHTEGSMIGIGEGSGLLGCDMVPLGTVVL